MRLLCSIAKGGMLMMPKWQRILWGIVYLLLIPVPLLYFYWDNILGLAGGGFLLFLAYYIFFKDHSPG